MPLPTSTLKVEPADQSLLITLTAQELDMLTWLASQAGMEPGQLLADFAADLACSYRNGGSDEREFAFSWYKRRGYTGDWPKEHQAVNWRERVEFERGADQDDSDDR